MYEHNALGYWSGLALCLTKVRSSRARCPATALIDFIRVGKNIKSVLICIYPIYFQTSQRAPTKGAIPEIPRQYLF